MTTESLRRPGAPWKRARRSSRGHVSCRPRHDDAARRDPSRTSSTPRPWHPASHRAYQSTRCCPQGVTFPTLPAMRRSPPCVPRGSKVTYNRLAGRRRATVGMRSDEESIAHARAGRRAYRRRYQQDPSRTRNLDRVKSELRRRPAAGRSGEAERSRRGLLQDAEGLDSAREDPARPDLELDLRATEHGRPARSSSRGFDVGRWPSATSRASRRLKGRRRDLSPSDAWGNGVVPALYTFKAISSTTAGPRPVEILGVDNPPPSGDPRPRRRPRSHRTEPPLSCRSLRRKELATQRSGGVSLETLLPMSACEVADLTS